jgi:hypothetical protein
VDAGVVETMTVDEYQAHVRQRRAARARRIFESIGLQSPRLITRSTTTNRVKPAWEQNWRTRSMRRSH